MAQTNDVMSAAPSAAKRTPLGRKSVQVADSPRSLEIARRAVARLSREGKRALLKSLKGTVERGKSTTTRKETNVTVQLRRLSKSKQSRLASLLDKSNDGTLTRTQRMELQKLCKEADDMMLANSMALARAARPELFDGRRKLINARFRQAFGSTSGKSKKIRAGEYAAVTPRVSSDLAAFVRTRAGGRCEYCHAAQLITGQAFHIDHINLDHAEDETTQTTFASHAHIATSPKATERKRKIPRAKRLCESS